MAAQAIFHKSLSVIWQFQLMFHIFPIVSELAKSINPFDNGLTGSNRFVSLWQLGCFLEVPF
jgi:hypothetical protein